MSASRTEAMTVILICPLWERVAEVTARRDDDGMVHVVGCSVSEPGSGCLAFCEIAVQRWCGYAGVRGR